MISHGVSETDILRKNIFHGLLKLTSVHFSFEKLNIRLWDRLPLSFG